MSSAILIYLAIAGAGLIFFLASLLHGGDADFHGGDMHGHEGGHDSGDAGHGTSFKDFLSLRSIALMCVGFGLTAAVMASLGIFGIIIPIIGLMVGVVFAYLGIKLIQLLLSQEATTTSSLFDYNGQSGTVTLPIPENGFGEVLVASVHGEQKYLTARAFDGKMIDRSVPIEVVGCAGGDLLVRKIGSLPRSI